MKKTILLLSIALLGCQDQKAPICKTVTGKIDYNYFVRYPVAPTIPVEENALYLVLNYQDTIAVTPVTYKNNTIGECYH